jgi:hypothetical protein
MPQPPDPEPADVAVGPVLILLRGQARRAAEAAERAYAAADLLATDPSAMASHAHRGDLLWERATALRSKANELRLLAGDPSATAQQRIEAVAQAHALMRHS